jgi:glycosyltransferase involved in cell wall biosynthesis
MKVSVVIPAYNQAEFLGEAINSVLDQTYGNFELIVVNDASPDHTEEVVRQYSDPRLCYIKHPENCGLPAARNSGMRAATGELIALLDADDYFHPDKLEAHVRFLDDNPHIGVSYNNRFELNYSAKTIRNIYRAPRTVGLKDFLLGFPFAPSDMVIRKDWAYKAGLFNENHKYGAEDIDFPSRLVLGGCNFARIDRALNYRRHHSGRVWKIRPRIEDAILTLDEIFGDSRCPQELQQVRNLAYKNHYEILTFPAFMQNETLLGQELLLEAISLIPTIIQKKPCSYVEMLAGMSVANNSLNHEFVLTNIFSQFPEKLKYLSDQLEWAIARGYLTKGVREIIWGSYDDGERYFAHAYERKAKLDLPFIHKISHQLQNHACQYSYQSTNNILEILTYLLLKMGKNKHLRYLKGNYYLNQAFDLHQAGSYIKCREAMKKALIYQPNYLINRGVLAMLVKSLIGKRHLITR